MASLNRVPIVDVTNDNFGEVWPTLIMAMSSSSFIALDTELSGLGNRKKLNAKSIEERFIHIKEAAKSRSVLSLGISCFKAMGSGVTGPANPEAGTQPVPQSPTSYIVQTFNIMLLCEEDYVVEPSSLQFLVQHGFDFNKQYEKGLSYYRGEDKETDKSVQSVRHLFTELVSMEIPIILHNGLVDLMFLYENLYTSLPASSAMFLADLVDMFPGGLIDTKYITDYEHLMQASYLEYVFRKCLKDNSGNQSGCSIHFPHYPDSYPHVTYRSCNFRPAYDIASNPDMYLDALCINYSGHGWCPKGKFCPKSHDIDLIIDVDSYKTESKSRKRRRRKERQETRTSRIEDGSGKEEAGITSDNVEMEETVSHNNGRVSGSHEISVDETKDKVKEVSNIPLGESTQMCGGHRAGFDAFMTGFIYAVFLLKVKSGNESKIEEWKNKLYLVSKDYPLTISKSAFAKHSKQHLDKILRIRKQSPPRDTS